VAAVLAGGRVEPAPKGAVHGLGGAEPAGLCDDPDRTVGGVEQPAGAFEAGGFDVVVRGDPDLRLERPTELPLGQVDLAGQRGDRQVLR